LSAGAAGGDVRRAGGGRTCREAECSGDLRDASARVAVGDLSWAKRAEALRARIEQDGFDFDEGSLETFEAQDCAEVEYCWANNPSAPYGFFLFPLGPGEPDPDPELRGPYTGTRRSVFRLLPNEAIVLMGRTPPPSPYFSFAAYVFSRHTPIGRGAPPYDDRVEVFASIGETQNQLTLETSAGAGESAFDQETALVITADEGTDLAIRERLRDAGFADEMINTLVLPRIGPDGVSGWARMGYANEDDLLTVLMRVAHPDALRPGSAIRAWLDAPPVRVFRVRPPEDSQLLPFGHPPLRVRGTGESERLAPLNRLVGGILDEYHPACVEMELAKPARHENGAFCLENMIPCFADCRDTPYLGRRVQLGPGPEDAVIVAGVDHEKTGKASFVNVVLTRLSDGTGLRSVVMRDLAGSGAAYLRWHPNGDAVWYVKFARRCDRDPYCFELTEREAPAGSWLAVVTRAYLEPATKTAAKTTPAVDSEIVFPRIIYVDCDRTNPPDAGELDDATDGPWTLGRAPFSLVRE
jgi:hypothetical protein